MIKGRLFYNYENDRLGIFNFNDGVLDNGLHCGTGLKVFHNGQWIDDRLEFYKNWYLVETKLGSKDINDLIGCEVILE